MADGSARIRAHGIVAARPASGANRRGPDSRASGVALPADVHERLRRSVETLYRLIDSRGMAAVSAACELIRLDRLVRRYPAAARRSVELMDHDRAIERADRA